jgi:hypothetical protein
LKSGATSAKGLFAKNLGAAMEGGEKSPAAEPLHVGGMFFAVLWARIKRLFGG